MAAELPTIGPSSTLADDGAIGALPAKPTAASAASESQPDERQPPPPDAPTLSGDTPTLGPALPAEGIEAGWSMPASSVSMLAPTLPSGVVLSERYQIVRLLGEGGMGSVYLAQDLELERPVALKIIRAELAGEPEVLRRFKQEINLARDVTHPNVVRIFDLGTDAGLKFVTMEYVAGEDLKTLIRKGEIGPEDATAIMIQVCGALQAAHDAGVVHRDLKPQNIMVDANGVAHVMDFGVAHSMNMTGVTRTGELLGTPAYMSPEQAQGQEVDGRSDIFSLGIIFYELLSGVIPFMADKPFATLLKRTQETAPPLVSIDPEIPEELNRIVGRCLEMEAELRYQGVGELLDDLEAGRPPRRHSTMERLPYVLKRSSWATRISIAVAVSAVVAAIGLGVRSWLPLDSSPAVGMGVPVAPAVEPLSLAILPFRNASGAAELDWLSSSLAEMLRTDVGQSAELRTVPTDRILQILSDLKLTPSSTLDDATLVRVGRFSNAEMLVSGEYARFGERIRIDAVLHNLDSASAVALKAEAADEEDLLSAVGALAVSIRENIDLSEEALRALEAASFTPSTASIVALRSYNEGLSLERQGNYGEAVVRFQAAVAEDRDFALAHSRLGQTYFNLGFDAEAEEASRSAVQLATDLPDFERYLIEATNASILSEVDDALAAYERLRQAAPADPGILFAIAELHEANGNFDQARQDLQRVLRYDPNYVDANFALGRVEIQSGNPQASLDPLNVALRVSINTGNDEARARMLNAIGIAYRVMGRPEEASPNYESALEIRRRIDDKDGIASSLSEIATIQDMLGYSDEALAHYEESLEIRREIGNRSGVANSLIDLGSFHAERADFAASENLYKEALQIVRELGDEFTEALCLNHLGTVYLERGEYADALTYFDGALSLREGQGSPFDIGETLHNLGETRTYLGQYDEALDSYLAALDQWRAVDDAFGIAAASFGIGRINRYQGRLGAALRSHQDAVDSFREIDSGYWTTMATIGYAAALGDIGRLNDAAAQAAAGASLATDQDSPAQLAAALNVQARIALLRDGVDAARSFAEDAVGTAGDDDVENSLTARLNRAWLALESGDAGSAATELAAVAAAAEAAGARYLATEASILAARASIDAGDTDPARRLLRNALRTADRLELRVLQAQAHYELARAEEADGDVDSAGRHLQQVKAVLAELDREAPGEDLYRRADLRRLRDALTNGL